MRTTAPAKKKNKCGKLPKWVPLIAGLAVVCAIVIGILTLESGLSGSQPEPSTERISRPTEPTEPPLPENPYGPEDFAFDENGYMSCLSGEYRLGIDVSDHQNEIDWQQVADAGIEFAFVRIGYRGTSEGSVFADDYAAANLQGAAEAGLQVGAYFYSQALTEEEAAEEAEFCLELLDGFALDLPLVFDWEYAGEDARTGNMRRSVLTGCVTAFCDRVEAAGYEPMIYFNPTLADTLLDLSALREYPFWLAMYSDTMDYPYRFDVWQFTDSGSIPGIEGGVDLNIMPG